MMGAGTDGPHRWLAGMSPTNRASRVKDPQSLLIGRSSRTLDAANCDAIPAGWGLSALPLTSRWLHSQGAFSKMWLAVSLHWSVGLC